MNRETLKNLIEELMDFVVATDPIKRIRRLDNYGQVAVRKLLEKIDKQEGEIYLAEVKDKIVGYIAGFPTTQSEDNLGFTDREIGMLKLLK